MDCGRGKIGVVKGDINLYVGYLIHVYWLYMQDIFKTASWDSVIVTISLILQNLRFKKARGICLLLTYAL